MIGTENTNGAANVYAVTAIFHILDLSSVGSSISSIASRFAFGSSLFFALSFSRILTSTTSRPAEIASVVSA